MMEWLRHLHSAEGITEVIQAGGLIALIGIVFAETGLLVGFFLPGDSLLITAGLLANPDNPHHIAILSIAMLNISLGLAAVLGDQTGFFLGRKAGRAIWDRPDGRFYKRKHLEAAHAYYEKWGGLSIVGAHFIPILRTFVPFSAGVARMPYRNFVLWNITGVTIWITALLWIGYYLGQTPLANRLDKVILLVIFISFLPLLFGALKVFLKKRLEKRLPSPGPGA